ncbi:MAG: hypothetical protein ACRCUI_10530, partial [Polymorphobacter sp.]
MRVVLPALAILVAGTAMSSCDRAKPEPGAEARASVDASPAKVSALSIDTDGFKADIQIPGIEFSGDKLDIDGIMLPKGSVIKGMKIRAVETAGRDHGSVVF